MKSVLQGATLLSLLYDASCLMSRRAELSVLLSSSRTLPFSTTSTIDRISARSSATNSDDFFSQQSNSQRAPERAELRTKVSSEPLVDSELLRFLSTQKLDEKESRFQTEAVAEKVLADMDTQRIEGERKLLLSPTVPYLDAFNPPQDAAEELWMGQYNANRVAKLLVANSVDESDAMQAGIAVQSHVLGRTARRKVREFLKRREKIWIDSKNTTLLELPGGPVRLARFRHGLDDVVKLLLENGLTGKDIAAILIHTPGVALMTTRRINDENAKEVVVGETLEDTIKRAYDGTLLESLQLRKYDARKVLRMCPGLLTKKGSRKAEDVVTLLTSLGVSRKSLARDSASLPMLLSRSPSDLFRCVAFLASDEIRMPVKSIGPLLRRSDCVELLNVVAPISGFGNAFSDNTDEGNVAEGDGEATPTLFDRRGEARRESINQMFRTMWQTARFLRDEVGTHDLGKMIAAYPSVLLQSADSQILPCVEFLKEQAGVCEEDLPSLLQLYPVLLGTPISQLQKVVGFLKSLEVSEDSLPSIFRAFPSLLTLDVEQQMIPVVYFLKEIGIANIGRFVTRLPPVLGYSIERELRPKWDYLSTVCSFPTFELSTFPAYFSYPLDRVIKARYEYLYEVKRTPTQLHALDVVLRYGDNDFARQVANDDDKGIAFAAFLERRKKREERNIVKNRSKTRKFDEGSMVQNPSPKVADSSATGTREEHVSKHMKSLKP